jgi:predicted AAA+ superfamily ATPase
MFDFIRETRAVKEGLYNIKLEIPEDIYKSIYEDLNEDKAKDILVEYLKYRQDDARISNIKIEQNKKAHMVTFMQIFTTLATKKASKKFIRRIISTL